MRRSELVGLAALFVLGLYLFASGLLAGGDGRARAASGTIDLLFMSAQGRTTVSPLDFCTSSVSPPIHNPGRAIDVLGDNTGSLCAGEASSVARLRGWGFGSAPFHHTMSGWAVGGVNPAGCDNVFVGLIDVKGGLHGQLFNQHQSRTISSSFQMNFNAAPIWGAQYGYILGNTTRDNVGCTWVDYRVHQGTAIGCMGVNGALTASTQYDVWNFWSYINVITYTEGMHNCDT